MSETTTDTWQAVARELALLVRAAAEHARMDAERLGCVGHARCKHCKRLRFADACEAALVRDLGTEVAG